MLWKMKYSDFNVRSDIEYGKEKIMKKALQTFQRFPYLTGDLYKIIDYEKIYVASYEFDLKKWNAGGEASLKKVMRT